MREVTVQHTRPYLILKNDGYSVGDTVRLIEFAEGRATGNMAEMKIICMDDDNTSSHSTFAGAFRILNGGLFSLDGDSYDEDEEVIWSEKWTNRKEKIFNGLTVLVKVDWVTD